MRKLSCLRCKTSMNFARQEKIQLGQTGFLLGDWPNLIAGALEVDIWLCPSAARWNSSYPAILRKLTQNPKWTKPPNHLMKLWILSVSAWRESPKFAAPFAVCSMILTSLAAQDVNMPTN